MTAVAARHGVYRSLVFQWRRQAREGLLVPEPVAAFLPVRLATPEPPRADPPAEAPPTTAAAPSGRPAPPPRSLAVIEIELPDGVRVRVGEEIGVTALRRVLAALCG
jgi:transposase